MRPSIRYLKILVLIFLVCLLAYFNTLQVPFQFDDWLHIKRNSYIRDFGTFFSEFGLLNLINRSILVLTYTVNYVLGKEHTFGYHLVNLGIHFGVSVLLYLISGKTLKLLSLTRSISWHGRLNLPLVGALLFASHSVHSQSVTYLMSRSASLCTFFYLGSFYCFILATEIKIFRPPSTRKNLDLTFLWILIFFQGILGFGVKLIIISLPIMMLVYLLIVFGEKSKIGAFILKHKAGSGIITALMIIGIFYKAFGTSKGILRIPDLGSKDYSRVDYFFSQIKWSVFYYFKVLALPFNLNIDPDIPLEISIFDLKFVLSAILILSILFAAFKKRFPPLVLLGLLWMVFTMAPESSLVPLRDLVAEHRMYLPGMGFVLIITGFLWQRKWAPYYMVFLVLLLANTIQRNDVWISAKSLWQDSVQKSPNKAGPHLNYAVSLSKEENELAVKHYKITNELNPNYFEAHHNLADIYKDTNRCDEAIQEYNYALLLKPKLVESMVGMAVCYKYLGNYQSAIGYLKKALVIRPKMDRAFRELGSIYYFNLGDRETARFYFGQALRLNPGHPNNPVIKNLIRG